MDVVLISQCQTSLMSNIHMSATYISLPPIKSRASSFPIYVATLFSRCTQQQTRPISGMPPNWLPFRRHASIDDIYGTSHHIRILADHSHHTTAIQTWRNDSENTFRHFNACLMLGGPVRRMCERYVLTDTETHFALIARQTQTRLVWFCVWLMEWSGEVEAALQEVLLYLSDAHICCQAYVYWGFEHSFIHCIARSVCRLIRTSNESCKTRSRSLAVVSCGVSIPWGVLHVWVCLCVDVDRDHFGALAHWTNAAKETRLPSLRRDRSGHKEKGFIYRRVATVTFSWTLNTVVPRCVVLCCL